jgi:GT2 family glycosyltransferase
VPEVAVVIKTMLRDELLARCLDSVAAHIELPYRIYLADDGPISPQKAVRYADMRAAGHIVLELPEGTGASAARNLLIDMLGPERFVLRMDDDFELSSETNLTAMKRVLEGRSELGAVAGLERQMAGGKGVRAGSISGSQGRMYRKGRSLIKEMVPLDHFEYEEVNGVPFARCGYSRNMLLIRRDVFQTIRWEERLPFAGEHEDFLLQLEQAGWGLALTPLSLHLHNGELARDRTYTRLKNRWPDHHEVYRRKWEVDRIILKRPLRQRISGLPVTLKRAVLEPGLVVAALRAWLPRFSSWRTSSK